MAGSNQTADKIRSFVFQRYVAPARSRGQRTVTIRAGDVHKQMGLTDRMPAVCGAIGTKKFEKAYRVRQVNRQGPTQGADVFFTFEV